MAAIAHHCCAGTTAAASRAGVPQIAIPHFVDQPMWAARLAARGVSACATLSRRRLRADQLARAIRRCVDEVTLRDRARALAAELATSDPVAAAVEVVTALAVRTRG